MKIQVRKGNCLDYKGEVIILFHFSDIRPLTGNLALLDWRCNASVSILWKRKQDLLKFGQLTIIATQGKIPTDTVILAGLGAIDTLDRDLRKEACRLALEAALKVGAREVAVDGSSLVSDQEHITADDIRSILESIDERDALRVAFFSGDNRQSQLPVERHSKQLELSET
jgi:hypothetical protein